MRTNARRMVPPSRSNRTPLCWCAAWVVVTTAVVAPHAAAQQPGSAGATRPNLRVLQALPESQLFPLMNLLAESLGVRCDYCHVQVAPDLTRTPSNVGGWLWDRDDKPQKRTARDMMRMVIDLNAGAFKAEPRITLHVPPRLYDTRAHAIAAASIRRCRQ